MKHTNAIIITAFHTILVFIKSDKRIFEETTNNRINIIPKYELFIIRNLMVRFKRGFQQSKTNKI